MTTLRKDIPLATDPAAAWAALRDVGAVADRLTPGVLTSSHLEGDERVVAFAEGPVLRERIVSIDDAARRVAYGVLDGPFVHHSASMQVEAAPDGTAVLVWITDLLPDDVAPMVEGLMAQGAQAMQRTLRD